MIDIVVNTKSIQIKITEQSDTLTQAEALQDTMVEDKCSYTRKQCRGILVKNSVPHRSGAPL